MEEIYVHNNPNNLQYNDYIYVFLRLWYLPTTPQLAITEDSWLKVPALRTDLSSGNKFYTLPNQNLDSVALVKVSSSGHLLKMHKSKLDTPMDPLVFETIKENSINVSHWEKQNQQSWPYDNMFSTVEMRKRQSVKLGTTVLGADIPISNIAYTQIASNHRPKPCGCAKKR